MKDIRIKFNGVDDTCVVLGEAVEGKELYKQKSFVNLTTAKGSDPIYTDRGTNLVPGMTGVSLLNSLTSSIIFDIAALDTRYFVRTQDYIIVNDSPDLVYDLKLNVTDYNPTDGSAQIAVQFIFADSTIEDKNYTITTLGS